MPSRKAADGEYRDIAHPINSGTRDMIQRVILDNVRDDHTGGSAGSLVLRETCPGDFPDAGPAKRYSRRERLVNGEIESPPNRKVWRTFTYYDFLYDYISPGSEAEHIRS